MNGMESGSADNAVQNVFQVMRSAQCVVDLPHVLVAALYVIVLSAKIAYVPLVVPAFLLSAYREYSLQTEDGISTIRYTLSSILVCWFGTFAYRLAKRRMMMHKLVRLFTTTQKRKLI